MAKINYNKKYCKTFSFNNEFNNKILRVSKKLNITQNKLVELGIDNLLMSFEDIGVQKTIDNIKRSVINEKKLQT